MTSFLYALNYLPFHGGYTNIIVGLFCRLPQETNMYYRQVFCLELSRRETTSVVNIHFQNSRLISIALEA